MIRPFVFSFVFAAVAACAMLAAPQASARALGGFSIDTTGPVTPTPNDPWGGVQLCTAHLRKPVIDQWGNLTGWLYHMASGYSTSTCYANALMYVNMGYQHNPNPGFGFCQCHSGFNGYMVSSPSGNGPISVQNLSQEQVRLYDEGLLQLRQKYQFDKFAEEHELLLQAIESMPAAPAGH
jgi:hypothetical protein